MNNHLDHDESSVSRQDRELTLGTGTILGIFFGLVVLCGACFGAGYLMGHKAAPTPLTLADTSADVTGLGGSAKPAAGSPAASMDNVTTAPSATAPAAAPPAPRPAPVVRKPPPPAAVEAADDDDTAVKPTRATEAAPKAPAVKPIPPSALLPSATSTPAGAGSIMVQVAAVSHQEDAQLLLGALRARGYTVSARPSTADTLIHVQVGPFSNKVAAEAMRQRLLSDGYNAMLKY